jgi:hypothetical protein
LRIRQKPGHKPGFCFALSMRRRVHLPARRAIDISAFRGIFVPACTLLACMAEVNNATKKKGRGPSRLRAPRAATCSRAIHALEA